MQRTILKKFKKPLRKIGHGYHILIPNEFRDEKEIEVIIPKLVLICDRCFETFTDPTNFSKDEQYCEECFEALEFIKKNPKLKCRGCKKQLSAEEYRLAHNEDICESCWIKEAKKNELS